MLPFSRIITFGSSPVMNKGNGPAFTEIIANHLEIDSLSIAKPINSNNKIARQLISFDSYSNDFVIISWTSTTRFEFRTEHGWMGTNRDTATPSSGFEYLWYQGPGFWEYTGVATTLNAIILAQTFLEKNQIPYLFLFDNSEVLNSMLVKNQDPYITNLHQLINWDRFLTFENLGFIDWCKKNNYGFADEGNHLTAESHQLIADYTLANYNFRQVRKD